MKNDYLEQVIRRSNELNALEQAALYLPARSSAVRWVIAAAFGLLVTLLPSAGTAHAFFQII